MSSSPPTHAKKLGPALHFGSYAILIAAIIANIVMVCLVLPRHDKNEVDSTSRDTLMYIMSVLVGFSLGIGVVSVIELIHTKLTKSTSDGTRYISYKYSYALAGVIAVVVTLVAVISIWQSHAVENNVNTNAVPGTTHTSAQNDSINLFIFNSRLLPYTLAGLGLAHVVGLVMLTFLPHQFDQARKIALLAVVAALTFMVCALFSFWHATIGKVGGVADKTQQTQAIGFAILGVALAAGAGFILFKTIKTEDKQRTGVVAVASSSTTSYYGGGGGANIKTTVVSPKSDLKLVGDPSDLPAPPNLT